MSFFRRRPPGSSSSTLVSFYEGTGRDHGGRRLTDILQWDADRLESSHDYIQTLFPLPEESGVNWNAPVIDRQVFDAFRSRNELQGKLRDSFQKILWFYGFKLERIDGEIKVTKGDNYSNHSENWDARFDHNHLRISRIIRSLRVLGLEDEAKAFHNALNECQTKVSPRSREYWRRAVERALNLRPDLEIHDEDDTTIGPMFLREFEAERRVRLAAVAKGSDTQQQPGSGAADGLQTEKERENEDTGEKEEPEKPDKSAPEQVNGNEVAGDEKNDSGEQDSPADVPDHSSLEGAQVQHSTDGKKEEVPTS